MRSSIRLVRLFGIDIGVHYSWLFIFGLVAYSLAEGYFPDAYPDWSTLTYWVTGVIAAVLLFVSVLLHELAHSLVAKARGMSVRSITLFLFGGVSNLQEEPERAKTEFAMAIVGPLTSLVIAGVCWGVWLGIRSTETAAAATIEYLAVINALLAGFNLLPAFPLDGGRVLRSILWGTTGSLKKATNVAATTGTAFGWFLIIFGLFQLIGGNVLGGLWIAFIGWFLTSAAESSRRQLTLKEHLGGVLVKNANLERPDPVDPETTVGDVVRSVFLQHHLRAVPVCDRGRLKGILTITDVKKVPQEKWAFTKVGDIMTRDPLYTVRPEDDLDTALRLLRDHDINQVLVTQDGDCAGLVTRAAILSHLQFSEELGLTGPRSGGG